MKGGRGEGREGWWEGGVVGGRNGDGEWDGRR